MPKPKSWRDLNQIDLALFWSKMTIDNPHECWIWSAASTGRYGTFRGLRTHRLAWEIVNQRNIPEGMFACHHCDTPLCCNPEHIFIGTHQDNMTDAARKGRMTGPKREQIKW